MSGQRAANTEKLRALALEGLSLKEAISRMSIGLGYGNILAKEAGIAFAQASRGESTRSKLVQLALLGMTRDQVAGELGLSYLTVVKYGLQYGIYFTRKAGPHNQPNARSLRIAEMFKSGQTLQEIGNHYGITRERIRQILEKDHGLRGTDGGQHLIATLAKASRLNKTEAEYQRRYGCSRAEYRGILAAGGRRPWTELQRNTGRDGIKLDLTIWQWWTLWQESGHWKDRGRGRHGYWLFRLRSDAPLSLDNCCIAPGGVAMRLMRQAEPSRFARHPQQAAA